jgi:hypothetical protein
MKFTKLDRLMYVKLDAITESATEIQTDVFLKARSLPQMLQVKVKLSLCFNWAPLHEGLLGERMYSSTHSWPRH